MRLPFQVLAIPYRKKLSFEFCIFQRANHHDMWQFISGGGEDNENPTEAAKREIFEETGIKINSIMNLTSVDYIPADVIAECYRKNWRDDIYVIPEYHFAFQCLDEINLSDEHINFKWLSYDDSMAYLKWDSNKVALYELNCRLLAD